MHGPDRSRPRRPSLAAFLLLAPLAPAPAAHADAPQCAPALIDNGLPGLTKGTNGLAIVDYKDGLYLGQASDDGFDGFGLMRRVDNQWEPVGGGLNSPIGESIVSSLAVYDPDGPGPASELLIASGVAVFAPETIPGPVQLKLTAIEAVARN